MKPRLREAEVWELVPRRKGRQPHLHVTLEGPTSSPLDDAPRYMKLASLETGEVVWRAMWVFEEGNEELKESHGTQLWRRIA